MYRSRLQESVPRVREAVRAAAGRAGRDPAEVTLVAVTKGHPPAAVEAALDAGLRDLAENRMGSLEERARQVPEAAWHMVGHVQRRKAPRLFDVEGLRLLHSLDSLRLARRIERVAPAGATLPVLVQVNTSGEESKGGFAPEALLDDLEELAGLSALRVEGLMTMAPLTGDEEVLRTAFRSLRDLHRRARDRAQESIGEHLSMGMSNDYPIAVEEGSTMIRLGTALFGERPDHPQEPAR